jgi:hypothetical protein
MAISRASEARSLYLSLPRDLAAELMSDGVAAPYLRDQRIDPSLIPAVIVSAATATTTVVVTQLTKATAQRIASSLRSWIGRRSGSGGTVEFVIHTDGDVTTKSLTITAALAEEDLRRLLEQALYDSDANSPSQENT